MILTEKAEEDFMIKFGHLEWEIDDVYLNALIVEWFSSVGIYFNQGVSFRKSQRFKCEVRRDSVDESYDFHGKFLGNTQEQANAQAFKKANDIYNKLNAKI